MTAKEFLIENFEGCEKADANGYLLISVDSQLFTYMEEYALYRLQQHEKGRAQRIKEDYNQRILKLSNKQL